jgi:hypothetical protein
LFFLDAKGEMHFDGDAEAAAAKSKGKGCWHILDVIGTTHYPALSDFLAEAYGIGFSRRLSHTLPLDRLTPWDQDTATGSRHFLVHPKAIVGTKGATVSGEMPLWRLKEQWGLSPLVPCRVQAYLDGKLGSLPSPLTTGHWNGGANYPAGGPGSADPAHSAQDPCLFDAWLFRDPASNRDGEVNTGKFKPSLHAPYPVPKHEESFVGITYGQAIFAHYPIQLEMVQNKGMENDPEWSRKFAKADRAASVPGLKISIVTE